MADTMVLCLVHLRKASLTANAFSSLRLLRLVLGFLAGVPAELLGVVLGLKGLEATWTELLHPIRLKEEVRGSCKAT